MSTAINMFLTQVVMQDGIPFEVKNPKPSRRLRKALKEAEVHQERINQKVIEMLKSYLRP